MSHIPPRIAPNFRGAHFATILPPYLYNRPTSRPCDSDGGSNASCTSSSTHPCWRLVTLLTEDEVFRPLPEHFVRVSIELSSTKPAAHIYGHPRRALSLAPWHARSALLSSSSHLTGLLECLYYSLSTPSAGGPSHDVRFHAVRDHFTHYLLIAIRPSRALSWYIWLVLSSFS